MSEKILQKRGTLPLLIFLFSLLPLFINIQYSLSDNTSIRELGILQYDVLLIRISPVVEDITIKHNSPTSKGATVSYSINRTSETYIWITPETKGTINFTISFKTEAMWKESWGIITDKTDFYDPFTDNEPYGAYTLVTIDTITSTSFGNFTRNLVLKVFPRSSNIFTFNFPTSINAVFFIIITAFLVYINAFSLLNTGFKNKKEQISKLGWFLVILLLLGSSFIIYQLYLFTTFTSTWSL
jgi:hypothetical protein